MGLGLTLRPSLFGSGKVDACALEREAPFCPETPLWMASEKVRRGHQGLSRAQGNTAASLQYLPWRGRGAALSAARAEGSAAAMLAAEGGPWGAAAGGPAAKGPGLGHLLHMPSHTFVRIGRYHDAVAANVHAWRADVADAAACQSPYEPEHNTDMLVYAANMGGEVMHL